MQRIQHPTAAATLPPVVSTGSPGYFHEGTPGVELSTFVTQDWCNGVQEELARVIEVGGGEALALTDNTQLLRAIQKVVADYVSGQNFVPVATVVFRATPAAPAGWAYCGGQALNRVTEASLFAVIGTTFGAGNGSTTFNVPNIKKRVVRGFDTDESEPFGSLLADQVKAHTHTGTLAAAGAYNATLTTSQLGQQAHNLATTSSAGGVSQQTLTSSAGSAHGHSVGSASGRTGTETTAHTHGFATDNAGAHDHILGMLKITANYDTVHTPYNVVREIAPANMPPLPYAQTGQTNNAGTHQHTGNTNGQSNGHQHDVVIDAEASHIHSVVVPAITAHSHTVQPSAHPAHAHTVALDIPTHAHALTLDNFGYTENLPRCIVLYPMIKL